MSFNRQLIPLLTGVLAISFSPVFVKWVSAPSTTSAFYRSFYAMLILFILAVITNRPSFRRLNFKWVKFALLAGLFLAIDLIIWHKSILYIGAGPATLLGNSQVIFVTLFVFFLFKEKIHPMAWLLMPVIFTGLYLTIPATTAMVSPQKGFVMGILVGLTYAGFLLSLRYAHHAAGNHYPQILGLALIMACCSLITGGYNLVFEHQPLLAVSLKDQGIMVLMALIAQCFGWLLIQSSIVKLPGHQGSLLLLIQPVLSVLWGVLFFNEPAQVIQIAGMVLALSAIALYQFKFAPASS